MAEIFMVPNNMSLTVSDDSICRDFKNTITKNSSVLKTGSDNELSEDEDIQEDGVMKKPPTYKSEVFEDIQDLFAPFCWRDFEHSPLINVRALPRYATTYELEKFPKNMLVIFNQVNVSGYSRRIGTEEDVMALTNTFQKFGFEVKTVTDSTRNEVFANLDKFADKDFTDYGCLAVVILTYGLDGGILRAKEPPNFTERDVIKRVINKNPTLITKPKIVIFQASKGENQLAGIAGDEFSNTVYEDSIEGKDKYTLPVESDLLVIHSSFPGKDAYRTDRGSWFIQALCSKINMLADTEDLESIMTAVKRSVALKEAEKYNRVMEKTVISKQMPIITSTLIRKLYLRNYQGKEVTTSAKGGEMQISNHKDDIRIRSEIQFEFRKMLWQDLDDRRNLKESD